jgi:all-trans-retinol 13,14-reductase
MSTNLSLSNPLLNPLSNSLSAYLIYTVAIVGVLYAVFNRLIQKHKSTGPKGYIDRIRYESPSQTSYFNTKYKLRPEFIKPTRDRYSQSKVPPHIDEIVIGSGISGLTTAALLSKIGHRVLVLEQHDRAGGATHSFTEKGFEFDTGIHYIGNVEKRGKILNLLFPKDKQDSLKWDKMGTLQNGYVYDEVVIGDDHYNFPAGETNFIATLVQKFPHEEENLKSYINAVKQMAQKDTFFNLKIMRSRWLVRLAYTFFKIGDYFHMCDFYKPFIQTPYEFVSQYTNNDDLKAVLLGQYGDCGPLPTEGTAFMHCSVVNHYLNGGYYPRGGTTQIAENLVETIESTGGRVLVAKKVIKLLFEDPTTNAIHNKVFGVEMENGDKIYAPKTISATGVFNTFLRLMEPVHIPYPVQNKLLKTKNIKPSVTYVYLFVGMKGSPSELKLRSSNMWVHPSGDFAKCEDDYFKDPKSAPMQFFIGFPCAKDSSWESRYPNKSNAVILTAAKWDWFKEYNPQRPRHRDQKYKDLKDQFEKRILEEGLFRFYPHLRDTIEYTEVGTPVSFNHYLNSTKGECYGLNCTKERFIPNNFSDDWLKPRTDIESLYITGQDVTTLGFTGAMMSGILTAHSVLGYGSTMDILSSKNLIKDIELIGKI